MLLSYYGYYVLCTRDWIGMVDLRNNDLVVLIESDDKTRLANVRPVLGKDRIYYVA